VVQFDREDWALDFRARVEVAIADGRGSEKAKPDATQVIENPRTPQ